MQAIRAEEAQPRTSNRYLSARVSRLGYTSAALLMLGGLLACGKKEKATPQAVPAVSAVVKVNKNLEESLAKVTQKPASADSDNSPPKDGILTQERADKEAPVGAYAKLTIGSKGSEPYVVLRAQATEKTTPASFASGSVEVAVRTGPQAALPTVVFGLKHELAKADASQVPSSRRSLRLVANEVKLGAEQPGVIPEELSRQIAALKGSFFSLNEEAGQTVGGVAFQRAKAAPAEGDLLLDAAADALDAVLLTFPSEPIGKDGFYLSIARTRFLNTDVVAYQMVKVLSVAEQQVELDVTTRRYVVGKQLGVPGLEGTQVVQFQSNDKVQLAIVPQGRYPVVATVQQSTVALVEAPQGKAPFQIDSHAKVTFRGK